MGTNTLTSTIGSHVDRDYSLLATFDSNEASDLVTSDSDHYAILYDDDGLGHPVDFLDLSDSWTTNSTHKLIIESAEGQEYSSQTDTGNFILCNGASYNVVVRTGVNVDFNSLGFKLGTSPIVQAFSNNDGNAILNRCFANNIPFYGSSTFIYNFCGCDTNVSSSDFSAVVVYEGTVNNCIFIARGGGAFNGQIIITTSNATNTVIYNETASISYDSFYNGTEDYCAQNDNGSDPLIGTSINGILTTDFQDYPGGDYRLSYTSALRDAGLNLITNSPFLDSPQYDINGDQWTDTGVWDIGFNYVFKIRRAIRDATAWTANQTAMEAEYGKDNYYTNLLDWESEIPPDLIVADEQWVSECYNDWPSGLNNELLIELHTTSIDNDIVITTPITERHNGTPQSGFFMFLSIGNRVSFRSRVDYTTIDGIGFEDTLLIGTVNFIDSWGHYLTVSNCAAKNANHFCTLSNSTPAGSDIAEVYNNIVVGIHGYFSSGATTRSANYYNNTIGDVEIAGLAVGNDSLISNNVFIDCLVDVAADRTFRVASSGNATTKSTLDTLLGTIVDISTVDGVDFTEPSTGNYNLTHDSKLHGEGTDVGLAYDIISKYYRAFNGTTYIPIGAFNGLSKFTAIRIDQTAFDTLNALLQARYEGNWQSLLSTWESNDIPADLVTDNIQAVAECYNDFVGGLDDSLSFGTHVSSASQSIVIVGVDAIGSQGPSKFIGNLNEGFKLSPSAWVVVLSSNVADIYVYVSNIIIDQGRDTTCVSNTNIDSRLYLDSCYLEGNSVGTYGFYRAGDVPTSGDPNQGRLRNCILRGFVNYGIYSHGRSEEDFHNNTIISCGNYGIYRNRKEAQCSYINNVVVDCTICLDIGTLTEYLTNATSDLTGDITGIVLTDGIDFTKPSAGDYSIPTGSKLIDEGTDLSTDFTTDIVGTERG